MTKPILLTLSLLCVAAAFASCSGNAPPAASPTQGGVDVTIPVAPPAEPNIALGRRIFLTYCATCHGQRGDGAGPTARHLPGFPPTDFTLGIFKLRSTPTGSLPTDADMARVVARGAPGTAMPAWRGVLTEQDTKDVVAYVKTFNSRFVDPREEFEVFPTPSPAPKVTNEVLANGRQIYVLAKCWDCHGLDGSGNGPSAATLKDQLQRPTISTDLTTGIFKGGRGLEEMYRVLVTGLDGSPMPSYKDTLLMVQEYSQQLDPIKEHLNLRQFAEVSKFAQELMPMDAFYELDEAEQEKLMEQWRWELVLYVRSLSDDSWGAFWGTKPQAPLYGAE